jgi:hypothetical protein
MMLNSKVLRWVLSLSALLTFFLCPDLLGGGDGVSMAVVLFALPAASTTTQTVQFLPQYLIIPNGLNRVTGVRVSVLGESELINLQGIANVQALHQYRKIAAFNGVGTFPLIIPLANGLIRGKNVQISVDVNAGAALVLHGASYGKGNVYVQTLQQTVLAQSGQLFDKFAALLIPGALPADTADVNFSDGGSDRWEGNLLGALSIVFQGAGDDSAPSTYPVIDNAMQLINSVTYIPSTNREVVLLRYSEPGGMKSASI